MLFSRKNLLVQVKYRDIANTGCDITHFLLGYGGELYFDIDEIISCKDSILSDIKLLITKNNLPLRFHAPIASIDYTNITKTLSLLDPVYNKTARICSLLGIRHVVTHAEFSGGNRDNSGLEIEDAVLLWRGLSRHFVKRGIFLIFENHTESSPELLIKLFHKLGSRWPGLCIDTGHVNAFSAIPLPAYLKRYPRGSIKEVHLADNLGDDDTHLPLGKGNIDFVSFFENFDAREEKNDCVFVLEPRSLNEARESITFLQKYFTFM